ncbi:hypothetical protein Q5O14_13890 [Eubacteriaceae bacterium ES2]|nr:hypothetical protein Q5O14_13890 [Eubacteriaceae bacterium ES2]
MTYIKLIDMYDNHIDIKNIVTLIGGGEPYQFTVTININDYQHINRL